MCDKIKNSYALIEKTIHEKLHENPKIKRIIMATIGSIVTLLGIALIVLPGPAFIVIPLGLSILAKEFLWAKQLLHKIRRSINNFFNKLRKKTPPNDPRV